MWKEGDDWFGIFHTCHIYVLHVIEIPNEVLFNCSLSLFFTMSYYLLPHAVRALQSGHCSQGTAVRALQSGHCSQGTVQ